MSAGRIEKQLLVDVIGGIDYVVKGIIVRNYKNVN